MDISTGDDEESSLRIESGGEKDSSGGGVDGVTIASIDMIRDIL